MKLYPINTGNFKLDGGAMFGVVPKVLWQKTNPADENNLCTWAMRCLLIEDENRLILIDNGIGDKQSEKFLSYYYLHGDDTLEKSLEKHGFCHDDITDVVISHLHFDHCGGSVKWNKDKTGYVTAFKNATYWSNSAHWNWATEPNQREKASFLKENIIPIQECGQLQFADSGRSSIQGTRDAKEKKYKIFPDFSVLFVNGHTEAQMLPHIIYKGKTVVYLADLIPSAGHIPLPYIMSYDMRPLVSLEEKETLLNKAADEEYILFLEHDPLIECCTVQHTEKGIRMKDSFTLKEYFGE
ncbi:MAG: MBL fold metallo-hydrolase [Bacteroidota bacterium]